MQTPGWLNETLVWGQVNVNERDPETFDVQWWAEYWAACGLQGVTLNVGGPIAYYPTEVPLHLRSPYLGERDLLGECVEAGKRLGLRVLGRLDPTFTTPELRAAHPDWCLTAKNGSTHTWDTFIAAYAGRALDPAQVDTSAFLACSYSPYFEEYLLPMSTEVLERYELDGLWTNGWPFASVAPGALCHCPHCLQAWDQAHPGHARPAKADASDLKWQDYLAYASARAEDLQRRMREHVRSVRPDAVFISSGATRPETTVRWGHQVQHSDALGIDAQGRSDFVTDPARRPPLWSAGLQSELTRAVADGKPILRFIGTYTTDERVVRHGAKSGPELRLQMAQVLAHGERPKWHTIGGTSYDRRWMPGVRELDRWMADHRHWLRELVPVSDVGVVWSPRSVHLADWSGRPGPSHRDALVGWYGALLESRIPFEYVHEDFLRDLDRFRVLVLPSALCLSDEDVEAIAAFVAGGGALVAGCDALLGNEWGVPRSVTPVLGVEYGEQLSGPLKHSCVELDASDLFVGLGDTDLIAQGRWVRKVSARAGTTVHGAWIPDYPLFPTQDVVLPAAHKDVPLTALSTGAGGAPVVCLAADLDAAHGRNEDQDHAQVLTNMVLTALGQPGRTVDVRGGGLVDVRPWRQDGRLLVFLVNLDNARTHGSPVRELRPLGPLEVSVRLKPGEQAQQVALLRDDATCAWQQTGTEVRATVPSVDDFELLVVELAT